MSKLLNAKSKRDGPPQHEWLFADRKMLPDDEVVAAYYWEFGLETPDVIAEVESVRKRRALSEKVDKEAVLKWRSENPFPGVLDDKKLAEWTNRFNATFPDYTVTTRFRDFAAHFLCDWDEFPKLHWLQISSKLRGDSR
jgi:hypothetical protein